MPDYSHQNVEMDMIGAHLRGDRDSGHVYMFTLIDHLTAWADASPVGKRDSTIAEVLNREYFPC